MLAAVFGLLINVGVVGRARQDTNKRRRAGYVDAQTFFVVLNGIAAVGWLAGMLAVFLWSYEFSKGGT